MKYLLLTILLSVISFSAFSQIQKPSSDMSYRKKIAMADEFFQKGNFGSAAVFYQSAFEEKPKKIEIAFKAGEAFAKIRDYKNAAFMYQTIKEEAKSYPKGKYKYALALKQSGDYKTAMVEFDAFINSYKGEDFNKINDGVSNEINGCQLAILLSNEGGEEDIEIEHLSRMVNSDKNEFAPIPFVENLLYFSSMREGMSQIFRSERGGGGWDRPQKPVIFGSMEKPHFGHGTFTPDRDAFYFTQCEMNLQGDFQCDLYMMQRKNNTWLKPVRLPDYINEGNTTSTQPFVTVIDDKEILYFVSDRAGGFGGLDIWYVMKDSETEDFNFSLPINLGIGINTVANETTPFYDKNAEIMYFSSDGHPGFGGLDIFRSNGHLDQWDKPVNLGRPANSGSDDHYYVLGASKEYGYFISNRLEGTSKEYSDNDDIFYFDKKEIEVVIRGSITESGNSSKLLDNVTVELIEINGTGSENSLITKIFNDGEYYFKLSPKKKYKIEATKDGYETTFFELETNNFSNNSEFIQDLGLEKVEVVVSIEAPTKPRVNETYTEEQPEAVAETTPQNRLPTRPRVNETYTEEQPEAVAETTPQNRPPTKPRVNETYTEEEPEVMAETTPQNRPPTKPQVNETYTGERPEVMAESTEQNRPPTKPRVNETYTEEQSEAENKPTKPRKPTVANRPENAENYSEEGSKVIAFEELSYAEKQIGGVFWVDGKSYIRRNGELYSVLGIAVPGSSDGQYTTAPVDNTEVDFGMTSSPPKNGEYYKIQLVAVSIYKPYKYEDVKKLGAMIQLETTFDEYGTEFNRVMLTPFESLDDAKAVLQKVVNTSKFERAYIVKYVDDVRVRNSKIRLSSFRD
jgi:tetratricopeptide (TPR) repeat protein